MRISVFVAYYEPEIAASLYIVTNIYEAMADFGWDVDLFVPMPTRGVDDDTRKLYKKRKLETKCNGNLKIHRFSMMREGENTFLRAIRYLIVNLVFIWKGLWTPTDLIFVHSTPPTQGAMAAILKKFKRVPMVYNLQDIFPDSLVNTGMAKQDSLLWKIGRVIERFTYKNADKIIVISEDFKQNIIAKGVPIDKIELIYNWVDENAVVNIERDQNRLFDKYGLDRNRFYITHCGNIGLTQNMDMLLEAAKELEQHSDIVFILVGDGAYKAEVENKIAEKDIKNVKLLPFQPYEDISYVFSMGDVGLIISKKNVGQNSVPSKTWSIMSAERPILASFDIDSELSSIVKQANCGLCVQADEKGALIDAILHLFENRYEARLMGRNGRKYILNNLTRAAGTSKYINLLNAFDKKPPDSIIDFNS